MSSNQTLVWFQAATVTEMAFIGDVLPFPLESGTLTDMGTRVAFQFISTRLHPQLGSTLLARQHFIEWHLAKWASHYFIPSRRMDGLLDRGERIGPTNLE